MTIRIRRTKPQQALDILKALLKDQEAEEAKCLSTYWEANGRASTTRRAIALLDQEMLPGFEKAATVAFPDLTLTDVVVAEAEATMGAPELPPAPRIDEKGPGISDVWNVEDGSVTVHSALMYKRQVACHWCKVGAPFATAQRIAHYIVAKDEAGVGRGFSYEPCGGIRNGNDPISV